MTVVRAVGTALTFPAIGEITTMPTDQIAGWMPTAGVDKIIEHAKREGFAAGIEAAAKVVQPNFWGYQQTCDDIIAAIRALRPPAAAGAGETTLPLTPAGEAAAAAIRDEMRRREGFAEGIKAATGVVANHPDPQPAKLRAAIRALRSPAAPCPECGCPEPWHESKCSKVGHFTMGSASAPAEAPLPKPMTVDLDIPRDPAERERVRLASLNLCQCPDCGRMHKPLGFNKPSAPAGAPSEEDVYMALRLFVGAAVPISTKINPRGHDWCEPYLDEALKNARPLLALLRQETKND